MDMGMLFAKTMPFDTKTGAMPSTSTQSGAQTAMNAETAKIISTPFTNALKNVSENKGKPSSTASENIVKETLPQETLPDDAQMLSVVQAPMLIIDAVEKNLAETSEEVPSFAKESAVPFKVLTKELVDTSIGKLLDKASQMQKEINTPSMQSQATDETSDEADSKLKALENAVKFVANDEMAQNGQSEKAAKAQSFVDMLNNADSQKNDALKASDNENQMNAKDLFGDKLKETKTSGSDFTKQNIVAQAVKSEVVVKVPDGEVKETSGKGENLSAQAVTKIADDAAVKTGTGSNEQSANDGSNKQQESVLMKEPYLKEQPGPQQGAASEKKVSLDEKLAEPTVTVQTVARDFAPQKIVINQPVVNANDPREIADKMVEQARLMQKPGMSEMVIRLRPQHLGDMTIRIVAENGGAITASFHSNNSEVRGILQDMLPAMKQELSNSGLKVNDVGVYAGLGDFQSFAQHRDQAGEAGKTFKVSSVRRSKEEQELFDELQAKGNENQSNDGGVDYRV